MSLYLLNQPLLCTHLEVKLLPAAFIKLHDQKPILPLNHRPQTELLMPDPLRSCLLSLRLNSPPGLIFIHPLPFPFLPVILHILKYEHPRLLHVVLRDRPDGEHPHKAGSAIFAGLCLGVRGTDECDPATIRIPALVHHFEKMHVDTVGVAIGKGTVLRFGYESTFKD